MKSDARLVTDRAGRKGQCGGLFNEYKSVLQSKQKCHEMLTSSLEPTRILESCQSKEELQSFQRGHVRSFYRTEPQGEGDSIVTHPSAKDHVPNNVPLR